MSAQTGAIKRGPIAIAYQIKEDETGKKCTTYGMEEKGGKNEFERVKGRDHLGDTGVDNIIMNLK